MGPALGASCGKLRYTTREAAKAAADLKAGTDGPEGPYPDELRVYWHRKCRGYHITSQPKRTE